MSDLSGYGSASPQPDPADKARRSRRAKIAVGVLLAIGAVAFAAGWNPPTKTVHEFSEASDYNAKRESGCTNSGKGCHDFETAYTDFNDYHPNAECTTCHEYQGVGCIPCHMPAEVECQLCHDGTFEPAADVVRLSDPYPKGHYRESTHTAMGTDFSAKMYGAEEGAASAPCESCHSRDLAGSHTEVPAVLGSEYGESVGCGECHNDVRSFGQAEVLVDWKKRSCEACHRERSSSPMHSVTIADDVQGTGDLGCGSTGAGCHDDNNLHSQHADAPKNCAGTTAEGESACHVLGKEALMPTATSCGGDQAKACHQGYTNTEYTHSSDATLHAPTSSAPAEDAAFYATPCGRCHRMGTGGASLTDEHAIGTSARREAPGDVCANCHNNPASLGAIEDDWAARNTAESCSTCHGQEDLPAAHEGNLTAVHAAEGSGGCADTGAGCHPTGDLMEVGAPTTTSNIHADCLTCHDWTEADNNLAYDPNLKSCGASRDCHGATDAYDPRTAVHAGLAGVADGTDAEHHIAGSTQADARYVDPASGVSTACRTCHSMVLGEEHSRVANDLSSGDGTLCTRCHNRSAAAAGAVKAGWPKKNTADACEACHGTTGIDAVHAGIDAPHEGIELAADGSVDPGACTDAGCHGTAELRVLHAEQGCTFSTCHDQGATSGVGFRSCGGIDAGTGCHAGYSAGTHFVEHAGDLEDTVQGIGYVTGQNVGCFGCHYTDLVTEHENARLAGTLDITVPNACAICHEADAGGVSGAYASLPAVKNAIAKHDRRCGSCHASGTALDTSSAVASAHRTASTETTLAPGTVWSDPFDEWKAAFDAPTGSGHNVLSAALVDGAVSKRFPATRFELSGSTFTWALPKNTGATQWLKPEAFGLTSLDTDAEIQHVSIECSDCHVMTGASAGPQGAAARIHIDPEYSQTEYANPTADASQFKATGTARVICAKCHTLLAGSVEGTSAPGGAALHARHVQHLNYDPATNPRYWGEKCVDCHVRIPHAWKRPRLLIRTVMASDSAQVDAYPYVARDHDGLVGMRLRSFVEPNDLKSGSCVTSGCHPKSSVNRHPEPSDVPTATYWP